MKTSYTKNDLGKSFGITVAAMLVLQIALSLIFYAWLDVETKQYANWAYLTIQALYAVGLGSVTLLYAKLSKTNLVSATKMKVRPPLAHVAWGCIATLFLVICMLPVNEWFLDLFELMGLKRPETSLQLDLPNEILIPILLLIVCIVPAFTEEFLFRGTISASLMGNKNKLASLSICGALFALFHLSAAQTVHQFVLGAFLALLFFRSGSIWTTVCVHFFNNALAILLMFTVDEGLFVGEYAWVFAVVGALGFAGSVAGYMFTTKSRWVISSTNKAAEDVAVEETAQATTQKVDKMSVSSILVLVGAVAACLALWIAGLFV